MSYLNFYKKNIGRRLQLLNIFKSLYFVPTKFIFNFNSSIYPSLKNVYNAVSIYLPHPFLHNEQQTLPASQIFPVTSQTTV